MCSLHCLDRGAVELRVNSMLIPPSVTVVLGLHNCAPQLWWRHVIKPDYSVLTKQTINGQQREEFGM
jgi:hypothetical protein